MFVAKYVFQEVWQLVTLYVTQDRRIVSKCMPDQVETTSSIRSDIATYVCKVEGSFIVGT
jgi:hypothetical protein